MKTYNTDNNIVNVSESEPGMTFSDIPLYGMFLDSTDHVYLKTDAHTAVWVSRPAYAVSLPGIFSPAPDRKFRVVTGVTRMDVTIG